MSDDWGWFFTSAEGRANILRDQVDSLGDQLSSANRVSTRLSSQLATLSGSIETRLNALSAAFDAYVELGDIREQLIAHADTSAVRRDVLAGLEALAAGRPAERVDAAELPYWLPYAMNAVAAVAAGHTDPEAEQTARSLSPDADLFVVATCGALGQGEAVADRLPDLLVCDGTLSPAQVALWTAACQGVFGPILQTVESRWREALEAAGRRIDWLAWVREQSHGGTAESLQWLRTQTDPDASADDEPRPAHPAGAAGASGPASPTPGKDAADPAAAARDGLRAVIMPMINQGLGDEVALLERARELRRRIEDPTAVSTERDRAESEDADAVEARSVAAQVRHGFVSTAVGAVEHQVLASWIRPGLQSALDELVAQIDAPIETAARISTSGRSVTVDAGGADPAELETAIATITANYALRPTAQVVGMVVAAVLAVGALVLGLVGNPVAAFLVLVLALVAGGYALRQRVLRRQASDQAGAQIAELNDNVARQQELVQRREAELRSLRQENVEVAEQVRRQLDRADLASAVASA